MSCYWDALIKKIKKNDFKYVLELDKITPQLLADKLKINNKKVKSIIVNNNTITTSQQDENFNHIKNYDINTINNGYDCSTFDPFLILIADLFSITIINIYNGNKIIYKPIGYSRYNIELKNNKNHMS